MSVKDSEQLEAQAAIAAGAAGLIYSLAFVIITHAYRDSGIMISAVVLIIGGLLASFVNVALFHRLQAVHRTLALWLLILGSLAAFGAIVHGGYDLANVANKPSIDILDNLSYPNSIDPRGLLTFGFGGLVIGGWTWLMRRSKGYPDAMIRLGYVTATLLIVVYFARLIVVDTANPAVVAPAVAAGFILQPLWYMSLGQLWQKNAHGLLGKFGGK